MDEEANVVEVAETEIEQSGPTVEQQQDIDNKIMSGLNIIMHETAKYNEIIKNAKTEIKKKIFRKKIKKLQKELQMLLYLQHMREKQKESVTEEPNLQVVDVSSFTDSVDVVDAEIISESE